MTTVDVVTEKKCNRCQTVKLVEEFGKDSSKKDGLRGQCRVCRAELNRLHPRQKPDLKVVVVPGLSAKEIERQQLRSDSHRHAILRLIQRHQAEFDKLVYSEQVRAGLINVNELPRENWVSLI